MRAGDQLLQNKQHRELLESYNDRRSAAIAYMKAVRPSLDISGGALTDPKVHFHGGYLPWLAVKTERLPIWLERL